MKEGKIVERRDQVLIGRFLSLEFIASTFLSKLASINAPFFALLDIYYSFPNYLRRRMIKLVDDFLEFRVLTPINLRPQGERGASLPIG